MDAYKAFTILNSEYVLACGGRYYKIMINTQAGDEKISLNLSLNHKLSRVYCLSHSDQDF